MLHLRHALPGSSLGWWSSRFSCGVWLLQCRGLVALIRWGPWCLGWKVRNVRNARNNKTPTKDEIFFLEDGDVPFIPLGKLRWKLWMKVHCFVSCVLFANVGWSQIGVTTKLCLEFWLGLQFSQKTTKCVNWRFLKVVSQQNWKIQHESGHGYQLANHLNDIMTSTHRNPFLFHHESFLQKKKQCVGVCPKWTKLKTDQEQFTPEPLASLWWWGDCPLADRGVVTCSSASIWKRSGFHLSTCRSFVSNASGLRCDTDFFLGGMGWDFRWI